MAGGNNNTLNAIRGLTQGNVGGRGINQGGRGIIPTPAPAGVRTPNAAVNALISPNNPPPNAAAAPAGSGQLTAVGLCQALNDYENQLVKDGQAEQANFYEVQFVPDSLKNSTLKLSGTTDKNMLPMPVPTTANAAANPNQNNVNYKGLLRSISQGTQVVQFIETIMRNSSFITDQQTYKVDSVIGSSIPNASPINSNRTPTQWFKISLNAVPISDTLDTIRNDYAYHMTYIVSPYQINQADSQYFPDSTFRGAHKIFNYWFTGENTQILHYEQNFNTLYYNVIGGSNAPAKPVLYPDIAQALQYQNKRVPATRTGENDQGATNGANNPASSLADYLYSLSDQKTIDLKIIGDPAFILQGEVTGLTAQNFNFGGFYPDGTINPDIQQAVFIVKWNSPADYDNAIGDPYQGSGLMDINAAGQAAFNSSLAASPAQQSAAYSVTTVKSTFSKGKFEQDLHGALITNLGQQQLSEVTASAGRSSTASNTSTPAPNQPQQGTRTPNLQTFSNDAGALLAPITTNSLNSGLNPSLWTNKINNILQPTGIASSILNLGTPQPANPNQLPSSNGINLGPVNISTNAILQNLPNGFASTTKAAVVSAFNNFNKTPISTVPPVDNTYSPTQTDASIQVYGDTQVQVNTESQIMAPPEDSSDGDLGT